MFAELSKTRRDRRRYDQDGTGEWGPETTGIPALAANPVGQRGRGAMSPVVLIQNLESGCHLWRGRKVFIVHLNAHHDDPRLRDGKTLEHPALIQPRNSNHISLMFEREFLDLPRPDFGTMVNLRGRDRCGGPVEKSDGLLNRPLHCRRSGLEIEK